MSLGKLLFSYQGRISVAYFWLGILLQVLIVLASIAAVLGLAAAFDPQMFDEQRSTPPNEPAKAVMVIGLIIGLVLWTWMHFAIMVKRCHDRNKSGWFSLLSLIPYVGFFWWVIDLGILEGYHGPNEYGPDPQNRPSRARAAGTGQWAPAGTFDAEQIRKLKALLDDGLITKEEFERKKQQLMGI